MSNKKPLQEGDVQSYAKGKAAKKLHPDKEIHLDHIPSKQAIKLAYVDAIGEDLKDISRNIITAIEEETTTLATYRKNHSSSSTSKINIKLAHLDKDVLALASVRDLEQFKSYELQRGALTEAQIDTSIEKVHARNYDLGLYTKNEVGIAQKYVTQLKELKLHKHADLPSYKEIAEQYRAELNKAPKLNLDAFENRLSKPSVIVGATLASMVFTDNADASTIPTLHLHANLPNDSYENLSKSEQLGAQVGVGFNAINTIQASQEFKEGASKSAKVLLDADAYKQGLQEATQAWKPNPTQEVVKLSTMESAKFAGKSALKKLPLIGLGAGIAFGIGRAMDGDFNGAVMEIASGAASIVPGWGTAASVGIDAALLEKDTHILSHGIEKVIGKEKAENIVESEDNHSTQIPQESQAYFHTPQEEKIQETYQSTQNHDATLQKHFDYISQKYGSQNNADANLDMGMERD